MTAIDVAERQSRYRATSFYFFAAMSLLTLWVSMAMPENDLLKGLWTGLSFAAVINLLPVARWLRPNSAVARLLDDDGVQEHRRMSSMAGFWASIVSAFAVAIVVRETAPLSAFDAVRVVATAAISAALISFATLELRAARG